MWGYRSDYRKVYKPILVEPKANDQGGNLLRILESAQNANIKAGVIGRAIGGVEKLSHVLEGFYGKAIIDKYSDSWECVLDDIVKQLGLNGIRRTPRSIWPYYCQTILSAAHFIEQFKSASDFFDWIEIFDADDLSRASLPMLLSYEIKGFGYALACDFLKEMGYINFPKPDIHLRDIFTALDLCPHNADDYRLFKAIVRVANHAGVSAYNVDKVFWLIGSGYFYDDLHIGKNGRVGSKKRNFIEYAKPLLKKL